MKWAIQGYYGLGNLGDDLMLYLLVENIIEIDSSACFTILCSPRANKFNLALPPSNCIEIIPTTNIISVFKAIIRNDILITGGGTCLQPFGACWLKNQRIARLFHKKIVWLGIGVEKIDEPKQLKRARNVLGMCDKAVFRDKNSLKLALKYRPQLSCGEVSEDIAYLILDSPTFNLLNTELSDKKEKILLIGWRDYDKYLTKEDEEKAMENVVFCINMIIDKYEFSIVRFICQADDVDKNATWKVFKLLNSTFHNKRNTMKIELVKEATLLDKINEIKKASLFITGRLHGFIVSKILGIPSVGISYSRKVEEFSKLLDKPSTATLKDVLDMNMKIVEIAESEIKKPSSFVKSQTELLENSKKNINVLNEYIRS